MKKVFAFSLMLILMFAVCFTPAGAAEAAGVDIWVHIINGGTAVITSEVNCPLPDKSRITLEDGQSEAFHIDFTKAGTYSYLVEIEPDERELTFDETVYNIKVFVYEENGKLYVNILIYNTISGEKYAPEDGDPCSVTFSNSDEPVTPTVPDESRPPAPTVPDESQPPASTEQPPLPPSGGPSKPQTGDDSKLDFYLLLAIFASAGLFMLSVFYYRSVISEKKQKQSG